MNTRSYCAFALAALLSGTASGSDWQPLQSGSTLVFSGESQGEPFSGEFTRFNAAIRFDPANVDGARFDVTVMLDSLDSQNTERDEALRTADFFDVAKYGEARFVADTFAATDKGYSATGTLSLRGKSRPVTLDFSWKPTDDGAELDGRATLNRLDFGVGGGDWADPSMIALEVRVTTHLVLVPVDQ